MKDNIDKERIDEALELIWLLVEEGRMDINRFKLSSEDNNVDILIDALKTEGLVIISENKIQFTDKGYSMAKTLVRRLRLAERLLTVAVEIPGVAPLQHDV